MARVFALGFLRLDPRHAKHRVAPFAGRVVAKMSTKPSVAIAVESEELYAAQEQFLEKPCSFLKKQLVNLGLSERQVARITEHERPIRTHNFFARADAIVEATREGHSFSRGDVLFSEGFAMEGVCSVPSTVAVGLRTDAPAIISWEVASQVRTMNGRIRAIDIVGDSAHVRLSLDRSIERDSLLDVVMNAPNLQVDHGHPTFIGLPLPSRRPIEPAMVSKCVNVSRTDTASDPPASDPRRERLLADPAAHIDIEAERAICAAVVKLAVQGRPAALMSVREVAANQLVGSLLASHGDLSKRVSYNILAMHERRSFIPQSGKLDGEWSVAGTHLIPDVRALWQKRPTLTPTEPKLARSLSNEQEATIRKVKTWFIGKTQPVFRLFGYAGTGKSTVILELQNALLGC